MKAYQITEWGAPLEEREIPVPEPQGSEILIKVTACGVCHSDVHIGEGYFDLGGGNRLDMAERGLSLPFTMGHEVVGEVAALGPDASGVSPGDRRIVFPWIGCGQCAVCQRGEELLCLTPRTVGVRVHGGFAEYCLVPDAKYLVALDDVSETYAATCACSGVTAISALKKVGRLADGESLLLIGAGGVGLAALGMARSVTGGRLIVADVDAGKRAAALEAGADAVLDNGDPQAVSAAHELTGGGPMAAIDFVGAPATSGFALQALAKGGLLVSVGLYGDALPISLALLPLKMLRISGSYVGTLAEMNELMALVRAGKLTPVPVTERPLAEAPQALQDLREGKVLDRYVLTNS
ncbi:MAG TPA: alcohol dehydrogenase [Alphaproteobacteria bacterium]|nr:alcohol dehydrogenase [Alphaproteobacteria bacterium]